jgi:hypothetical protein
VGERRFEVDEGEALPSKGHHSEVNEGADLLHYVAGGDPRGLVSIQHRLKLGPHHL